MCENCIIRDQKNEKPNDKIKAHDEDAKQATLEGVDVVNILLQAYDRLQEVPDDQQARNVIILACTSFFPPTSPAQLYQVIRDDRETTLEKIGVK